MKTQLHSSVAMVRFARALTRFLPAPAFGWVALLALAALTFGLQPAQAAVTEAWVHRYSNVVSNAVDQAFKVVSDAAGDIIVTGTSDNGTTGIDILTIKYSGTDGSVLWQRRYNSPANDNDSVSGVALDSSGNVVVVGTSTDGGSMSQGGEYYTAKYAAADGAIIWEKRRPRWVGSWAGFLPALVAVDSGGNVVVAMPALNQDGIGPYTAKYAAGNGALLWESPSPGGYLNSLAVDGSGNVFVAGSDYTAKYSADGNLLWETLSTQPGTNDPSSPKPVAVDGGGNLVVVGSFFNGTNSDFQTTKYASADGALLWTKRYNGLANRNDSPSAVAVDRSGNVVVTGLANRSNLSGGLDVYTAKYAAADGSLLWEKLDKRTGGGFSLTEAVAVDVDGNVVVAGTSYNNTADYYTAKYAAADGRLIWEKRYDGPGKYNGSDDAQSLTVDPSGDVIVTGTSDNAYYTTKYSSADAALVWEARHNGLVNRNDYATAVAVDASGDVVVTGISEEENGTPHYTAKYAAADGALLWEKRGPGVYGSAVALDVSGNVVTSSGERTAKYAAANGSLLWEHRTKNYFAVCVALDKIGNAVTSGYIRSANRDDYYTAKYAAADGSLLWEMLYSSPGEDQPAALAIDSKGNVVVAGHSSGQFYTAKYSAADGTLIWEKRYSRTNGSYDVARAVAVDGDDNVVVTGKLFIRDLAGSGPAYDYYTAKYAADNGVLLWEKSYDGPGKSSDEATGVAVDSKGNVVVTGYSQGDFYTAKYAGADGALLWEKRGPVGYASAVRVTSSGDVVVAGDSYSDYYTAKYASADGALLWEKRYNGPANSDDYASSLALGPNGIIAVTGSSDGNFGPGERFFDYATVVYREVLPALSAAVLSSYVRLSFIGTAGQSYNIQRAPAVTGAWTTINTQTAPASGLIQYEDVARTQGASFYRTSHP